MRERVKVVKRYILYGILRYGSDKRGLYCATRSVEKSISYETEGRVGFGFSHAIYVYESCNTNTVIAPATIIFLLLYTYDLCEERKN